IMWSTSGFTALALGTVVMTRSCSMMLVTRPLSRELREPTSRLSLYPPRLCRMISLLAGLPGLGLRLVLAFVFGQRLGQRSRRRRRRRNQPALRIQLHAE